MVNSGPIGSSKNLSHRFTWYFNISYISTVKNKLTILLGAWGSFAKKNGPGYSNFTLEILEFCEPSVLLKREQHYLDNAFWFFEIEHR